MNSKSEMKKPAHHWAWLNQQILLPLTSYLCISQKKILHKKFMNWRNDNEIIPFLENGLLAYVGKIPKDLKPLAVCSMYFVLCSTININVDIRNMLSWKHFSNERRRDVKAKYLKYWHLNVYHAPDCRFLFTKVMIKFNIKCLYENKFYLL